MTTSQESRFTIDIRLVHLFEKLAALNPPVGQMVAALNVVRTMVLMPLVIPGGQLCSRVGYQRTASNFGFSFLKFENAQVLFKGISSNTVLSLHLKDKNRVQIVVPNSSVHLLPN